MEHFLNNLLDVDSEVEGSFSEATRQNACLTFEVALGELKAVSEKFRTDRRFAVATDLCLSTRTAWIHGFPEWRLQGDAIRPQLIEMRDCFEEALANIKPLLKQSLTPLQRDRVNRFQENVGLRLKKTAILIDTNRSEDDRRRTVSELEFKHGRKQIQKRVALQSAAL